MPNKRAKKIKKMGFSFIQLQITKFVPLKEGSSFFTITVFVY